MKLPTINTRKIKPWVLPASMLGGVIFHDWIHLFQSIVPYLIFTMLLLTFCKVEPKEFKVTGLSWKLMVVQVLGSIAVYFAIRPLSEEIAQATFICILCPTATAAPVVTGMLGGNVARLATFSIISNLSAAIVAPIMFAFIGNASFAGTDFIETFFAIIARVAPMILLPLLIAFALRFGAPKIHGKLTKIHSISFYIWAVSLFIVVGNAVSFILKEPASEIPVMILIALFSAIACCLQFYIGRKIGSRYNEKITGAQGLGQKNTILAIWLSLTYMNPISSIGPAAYVAWQNTINSYQLYRKTKSEQAIHKQ